MSGKEIRADLNRRIKWWQTSFEGPDGRTNGNLLTMFAVMAMCIATWVMAVFFEYDISNNLLYLLIAMCVVAIFATGFFSREVVKSIAAAIAGQPYVSDNTNININNRETGNTDYGKIDNIDG